MEMKVLIVGGGLSGLHTAYTLDKAGIDYVLVEARSRFGGRILSCNYDEEDYDSSKPSYDLGPAWFWPGQVQMQALVDELDLTHKVFMQYSKGDALFENGPDIQRGISGISMQGSYRLNGGMGCLIEALQQKVRHKIECGMVFNNARVTDVHYEDGAIIATIHRGDEFETFRSSAVIMALPPRLAVNSIRFSPALSAQRMAELAALETWMAGQAKAVILYETPFWRKLGFSGDVVSQEGPMREIHDASPAEGGPYALFGFISVLPRQRQHNYDLLKVSIQEQLVKLFGPQASQARACSH
ncbi:MAG: flavin monoamine oxidase family protein [Arenicella sp.]